MLQTKMTIQSTICFYIQNIPYFTTTPFFFIAHVLVHTSSHWSMTATFLQITWGHTGQHWETVTWYNWHNIILRIWTLCSRDLFQQVTVIQFMRDIPFPFRFYETQWCRWELWWAHWNQSTPSHPDSLQSIFLHLPLTLS